MQRTLSVCSVVLCLAACSASVAPTPSPADLDVYIVMTDTADSSDAIESDIVAQGGEMRFQYRTIAPGFAATMTEETAEQLREDPHVVSVEIDQMAFPLGTQTSAPTHLDEFDSGPGSTDTTYSWKNDGTGVNIYVIDTGIRSTHTDFGSRVAAGTSIIGGGTGDTCGHGTMVSGIAAGTTYGVAKGATIVPVRIGCSPTTANLVSAFNWVAANGVAPGVVNFSFSAPTSSALDAAALGVISAGFAVVASIPDGTCACSSSLARNSAVIGVRTFGPMCAYSSCTCQDVFVENLNFVGPWYTSDTATNTATGVSYSTALTSGLAARYLCGVPGATPSQVSTYISGSVVSDPACVTVPHSALWANPML